MKCDLAMFGGKKAVRVPLGLYNSIGTEEEKAARNVIEGGVLSQFLGSWHKDFYGGPKVQEFEKKCAEHFGVEYVVTVNSWTSGLVAAVGAIGVEPGDEVIVTPWTMCASATAILHWNAIPVFADIEQDTFCIDPEAVESQVTDRTKAIMAVDIFGHSADMAALAKIAEKHNLKIISDSAQAPGAEYQGKYAGTLATVGGYSLNHHKHIHTGEGGILVTDNPNIAERLQLIRNHAEAVVQAKGVKNLSNMIGHNFRLGEIECAIGIEQLTKLEGLVATRQQAAEKLTSSLKNLSGIRLPIIKESCTHAYYIYAMVMDIEELGVPRSLIIEALEAEGLRGLTAGYANVHMLPVFQHKIAYGSDGFPWSSPICSRHVDYSHGICPAAEKLHDSTFMGFEMCMYSLTEREVDMISEAFQKVWANIENLKEFYRGKVFG